MQELQRDISKHTNAASNSTTSSGDCNACASTDESLEYLAQMVAQIGALASRAGHRRLALILELASDETLALLEKQAARQAAAGISPGT